MREIGRRFGRTGALVLMILLIFGMYIIRLFDWQIVQGEFYRELATNQNTSFTKLSAVRGEILDADGNVLAGNKLTYGVNLVYRKMDLSNGYRPNPVLLSVIDLLESRGESWRDELPILIDENGEYVFDEERPREIEYMKSAAMLDMQSYATAEHCMQALVNRFDLGGYSQKMTRALASLRYSMVKVGFSLSVDFMIADNVSQETVGVINEMLAEMPGIETDVAVTRYYGEDGSLAPHSVGRVGSISEYQYELEKEKGNVYDPSLSNVEAYAIDDRYGQSGLENAFESQLRGVNGKQVVSFNSDGTVGSSTITQSPKAGNTVHTTINSKVQAAANKALAEQIEKITERSGIVTGSAVALSVEDFGVLAASNYPSFDMNRYNQDSDYIQELSSDEVHKPLFNRALNGAYTPGSTFKPLVAIAGLEEGAINLSTSFFCERYFTRLEYAGYIPSCMSAHGYENVYTALRDSCNIFFYETGWALGIDKITPYAEIFGLGTKTGVELDESSGSMSNRVDYLKNHGTAWTEAITIQAAIGQADNTFTPMQLATFAATIANNGVRLKTHFLDKVTDYTGTHLVEQYEPEQLYDADLSATTIQAVKEGMRMVADDGTARYVFSDYDIGIAAKTGTAETTQGKLDNMTFIAFAPYENPEIALSVVIEHGGKGTNAQEVAKAMFDAYFGFDREEDETENDPESGEEKTPEGTVGQEPDAEADLPSRLEKPIENPGLFYDPKKESGSDADNTQSADDPNASSQPNEDEE